MSRLIKVSNAHRSKSAVHVFVVDEDGNPVTGQDVSVHFSYAQLPDTVKHQYSDIEGCAEFSLKHADEPLHVEIFVWGESCGRLTLKHGADYTVEISRE